MNLIQELRWRGMIQDIMPGTEEQLTKDKAKELMKALAQHQQETEHKKKLQISKLQWDVMQETIKGDK